MSSATFWATIAAKRLRGSGPSWPRANLRTPVSLACFHIPGTPDREPRQDDGEEEGAK